MTSRDKKILIGVGISLACSAAAFCYTQYHEQELLETAKYKPVVGGLEESSRKMQENAKRMREAAQKGDIPKAQVQPNAVAPGAQATAPGSPGPASVPSASPGTAAPSLPNKNSLVTPVAPAALVAKAALILPQQANLAQPSAAGVGPTTPQAVPEARLAEIASSDSSLYLRYKAYLFHVSLKKGINVGSQQLEGFSGQRVETIVSDDAAAPCTSNCYQLSEKLVGQLKSSKAGHTFLKTQGWFLVSDQAADHCDAADSKKLTVTQDVEGKCMLGMVSDGRTLHMASHDSHAQHEMSSVMILEHVAEREPASEN